MKRCLVLFDCITLQNTVKDTQIQCIIYFDLNTQILLKQFNKKFNPINNDSIIDIFKSFCLFFLKQNFE
jgi:hypothetical protein